MTKLKLLSAALIATAMIATPAMARTNNVTSRHLVENANASIAPGARNSDERHCHYAPRVGAFATQPWESGPRWVIDPSRVANPGGPLLPRTKSDPVSVRTRR
jgi:hypothetical protein